MIHIQKLTKRFGAKTVLRGLDFDVEQGEVVGIIGPNGAGKTTLLRILSSLSKPSFGKVTIAGYVLPQQATYLRANIGILSHKPILYGDLTAEQNLSFYGKMYAVKNLSSRIISVLNLVGLAKRRRDLVRTYSSGMQQRLAIARAIIHNPQLMLLDEPYTGLDQDGAEMLEAILRKIIDDGKTIVMTSHDLIRISELATRFDILSHGKIIASKKREQISEHGLLEFYRKSLAINKKSNKKVQVVE